MSNEVKGYAIPGIPEGWEAIANRQPALGEYYMDGANNVCGPLTEDVRKFHTLIVRKLRVWRSARMADLLNGPVECRYARNNAVWNSGTLIAINVDEGGLPYYVRLPSGGQDWVAQCHVLANQDV